MNVLNEFNRVNSFGSYRGATGPNGAPSNLVMTVNAKDGLSASFDSDSTNQDGYRVYVSTGGAYTEKTTGTASPINITGLTVGAFYTVKVVAYKGAKESDACTPVAETWSQGMTRSFLNINSHATWSTAQIALVQGRLSEDYVVNTFGPAGSNKTVCDFFVFLTSQATTHSANTITKTGATLRWNYGGGNIYSQNNVPAQTSTTEVSFTSTDGFGGVTAIAIASNKFYNNIPNIPYYFPNALTIDFSGGASITDKYKGDISAWTFNNNATSLKFPSNNLSGDLSSWQLPDKLTIFTINTNPLLTGKSPSLKSTWGNAGGTPITYTAYDCTFSDIGDRLFQKCGNYQMSNVIRLDGNCLSSSAISAFFTNCNAWYQTHPPYSSATNFNPNFSGLNNGTIIGEELNADLIALKAVFVAAGKTCIPVYNSVARLESVEVGYVGGQYNLTPLDKGTLVITSDDGYDTDLTKLYPMLQARGKVGTTFTYGDPAGNMMSIANYNTLIAAGWDVQGHPEFNAGMNEAAIRAMAQGILDVATNNGFPAFHHFSYGGGYYNALVQSVMPDYVLSCRYTAGLTAYTHRNGFVYKDSNKFALPSRNHNYTTQAQVDVDKELVRVASIKKAGLIMYNHEMTDAQIAFLAQVVDYAISLGMDIVTISALYTKIIS